MVMRKLISKNDKSVVEVRTHDLTIRFDNGMFITISYLIVTTPKQV